MVVGMSSRVEQSRATDLGLGAKDWKFTPNGHLLATALADQDWMRAKQVLEVGAGVGRHATFMLRQGSASIVTTEFLPELTRTSEANVQPNLRDTRLGNSAVLCETLRFYEPLAGAHIIV